LVNSFPAFGFQFLPKLGYMIENIFVSRGTPEPETYTLWSYQAIWFVDVHQDMKLSLACNHISDVCLWTSLSFLHKWEGGGLREGGGLTKCLEVEEEALCNTSYQGLNDGSFAQCGFSSFSAWTVLQQVIHNFWQRVGRSQVAPFSSEEAAAKTNKSKFWTRLFSKAYAEVIDPPSHPIALLLVVLGNYSPNEIDTLRADLANYAAAVNMGNLMHLIASPTIPTEDTLEDFKDQIPPTFKTDVETVYVTVIAPDVTSLSQFSDLKPFTDIAKTDILPFPYPLAGVCGMVKPCLPFGSTPFVSVNTPLDGNGTPSLSQRTILFGQDITFYTVFRHAKDSYRDLLEMKGNKTFLQSTPKNGIGMFFATMFNEIKSFFKQFLWNIAEVSKVYAAKAAADVTSVSILEPIDDSDINCVYNPFITPLANPHCLGRSADLARIQIATDSEFGEDSLVLTSAIFPVIYPAMMTNMTLSPEDRAQLSSNVRYYVQMQVCNTSLDVCTEYSESNDFMILAKEANDVACQLITNQFTIDESGEQHEIGVNNTFGNMVLVGTDLLVYATKDEIDGFDLRLAEFDESGYMTSQVIVFSEEGGKDEFFASKNPLFPQVFYQDTDSVVLVTSYKEWIRLRKISYGGDSPTIVKDYQKEFRGEGGYSFTSYPSLLYVVGDGKYSLYRYDSEDKMFEMFAWFDDEIAGFSGDFSKILDKWIVSIHYVSNAVIGILTKDAHFYLFDGDEEVIVSYDISGTCDAGNISSAGILSTEDKTYLACNGTRYTHLLQLNHLNGKSERVGSIDDKIGERYALSRYKGLLSMHMYQQETNWGGDVFLVSHYIYNPFADEGSVITPFGETKPMKADGLLVLMSRAIGSSLLTLSSIENTISYRVWELAPPAYESLVDISYDINTPLSVNHNTLPWIPDFLEANDTISLFGSYGTTFGDIFTSYRSLSNEEQMWVAGSSAGNKLSLQVACGAPVEVSIERPPYIDARGIGATIDADQEGVFVHWTKHEAVLWSLYPWEWNSNPESMLATKKASWYFRSLLLRNGYIPYGLAATNLFGVNTLQESSMMEQLGAIYALDDLSTPALLNLKTLGSSATLPILAADTIIHEPVVFANATAGGVISYMLDAGTNVSVDLDCLTSALLSYPQVANNANIPGYAITNTFMVGDPSCAITFWKDVSVAFSHDSLTSKTEVFHSSDRTNWTKLDSTYLPGNKAVLVFTDSFSWFAYGDPTSTPPTGGWGWGGGSIVPDNCTYVPWSSHNLPCANTDLPNGKGRDYSHSSYDGTCCYEETHGSADDTCTAYTPEINSAYNFWYQFGLTTLSPCTRARLQDKITRAQMAKMLVQFVTKVLWWDTARVDHPWCSEFKDIANISKDLQANVILSCKLWIMWLHPDWTPLENFMPNETVYRKYLATTISRILRWQAYEAKAWELFYTKHIAKLVDEKIITQPNPNFEELRSRVLIILERIFKEMRTSSQ